MALRGADEASAGGGQRRLLEGERAGGAHARVSPGAWGLFRIKASRRARGAASGARGTGRGRSCCGLGAPARPDAFLCVTVTLRLRRHRCAVSSLRREVESGRGRNLDVSGSRNLLLALCKSMIREAKEQPPFSERGRGPPL